METLQLVDQPNVQWITRYMVNNENLKKHRYYILNTINKRNFKISALIYKASAYSNL